MHLNEKKNIGCFPIWVCPTVHKPGDLCFLYQGAFLYWFLWRICGQIFQFISYKCWILQNYYAYYLSVYCIFRPQYDKYLPTPVKCAALLIGMNFTGHSGAGRIYRIFRILAIKQNKEATLTFSNNTIGLFGFLFPLKTGWLFLLPATASHNKPCVVQLQPEFTILYKFLLSWTTNLLTIFQYKLIIANKWTFLERSKYDIH